MWASIIEKTASVNMPLSTPCKAFSLFICSKLGGSVSCIKLIIAQEMDKQNIVVENISIGMTGWKVRGGSLFCLPAGCAIRYT